MSRQNATPLTEHVGRLAVALKRAAAQAPGGEYPCAMLMGLGGPWRTLSGKIGRDPQLLADLARAVEAPVSFSDGRFSVRGVKAGLPMPAAPRESLSALAGAPRGDLEARVRRAEEQARSAMAMFRAAKDDLEAFKKHIAGKLAQMDARIAKTGGMPS